MKKILIFCDFYLPSIKSGGGMWTIVNLVDRFFEKYEFYIVTRNYDSKGDTKPYTAVKTGEWNTVGNAKVFYVSKDQITAATCASLVREIQPDAIFLNSAFSTPVVKLLSARRRNLIPKTPVVIAPCGELSKGALAGKSFKKKLFLMYAKTTGLFRNVIWKASSELEASEIKEIFGSENEVMVAPDLAPRSILPEFTVSDKPVKSRGAVRFVILSRIVRKKNIHFFFECLLDQSDEITVDIVGPIEDTEYFAGCRRIIDTLPDNITINVVGAVSYSEGLNYLVNSHFFALSTVSENFGYVFLESLAAGTPLVISDQTVWHDIGENNAGWVIPLDDPARWSEIIRQCAAMENSEYLEMAADSRKYAEEWLAGTEVEAATGRVLARALDGGSVAVNG